MLRVHKKFKGGDSDSFKNQIPLSVLLTGILHTIQDIHKQECGIGKFQVNTLNHANSLKHHSSATLAIVYSGTSDSGPSKIGTLYNKPLFKGHCSRSQKLHAL